MTIASALWNNEFLNLSTNFIPAGMDSYSDTDTQMQIQTAPYPGSVTSHASNLGGELERIRYQISAILGATTPAYWYAAPPTNLTAIANLILPLGGVIDYHSATAPNANFLLANGQAIGRSAYAGLNALYSAASYPFGNGDGSTTFNLPNYTDVMSIGAGNLYAAAATGGAVSNTPILSDPGHNHTQNSHTHTMGNHTHSTPNHVHPLDSGNLAYGGTVTNSGASQKIGAQDNGSGFLTTYQVAGTTTSQNNTTLKTSTTSSGNGTSGTPSTNTSDATTSTNNSNTTGITSPAIPTLPPYLGMYKLIRVL